MFCIEVCKLQEGVYEWTEEIRLEILGLLLGNQPRCLCEGPTHFLSSSRCPR